MARRRSLLASAAVLATTLALGLPAPAQAATRGGTLTFARYLDSQFLDPTQTTQNADIWLSLNLYDTLLLASADGTGTEPGLATAYKLSDDGKSLTFTMRPGIKFADGSPIMPSDVKWSLDRARSKENGGEFSFLLAAISSIDTPGTDQVVLHLGHPDPVIIQALATFNAGIMPEKLFMAAPGATMLDKAKAFAEKPIGSGPFVLTGWKHNSEMTFVRNQYYWKDAGDGQKLPYLDGIRFVIIPDDATRILKLQAGEVDIAEFIPYARVAEMKKDSRLNMELYPAAQINYFLMNMRPQLKDGTKNPLSDVRVRQALNYATDKEALNQVTYYGVGTPMRSLVPMSTPMAYGPAPLYPYDIAKAKKLLADAGYASGLTVTIMTLAGSADDQAKVTTLQQLWQQVGVTLKVEQLEGATRLARTNGYDFQMRTSLWTNDINDPNEVISIIAYYPTRQSARGGYNDERTNTLFESSQQELDSAKRTAEFKEIQERYAEAAPMVFGLEVPYPVALRKTVHDFVQIPLGNNIFLNTWMDKK